LGPPSDRRNAVDLGVGLAEDAHRIARRAQIAFCGLLVGNPLFQNRLRYGESLVELAQARQIAGGQVQHSCCGNQVRFGRQQIGAVDCEQRLTLLHVIADGSEQGDDLALIGRKDLRLHVLVEVDTADRLLFDREDVDFGRLDLYGSELRIRKIEGEWIDRGRARRGARRRLCIGVRCPDTGHEIRRGRK